MPFKVNKNVPLAKLELIDSETGNTPFYSPNISINNVGLDDPTYIPPEANWSQKLPKYSDNRNLLEKLCLDKSILDQKDKQKLMLIIIQNKNAFVQEDGVIGCYNGLINHRIDLVPNAGPIKRRPYRTPLGQRAEIKRQVKEMLKQHIIQPSDSPFLLTNRSCSQSRQDKLAIRNRLQKVKYYY